MKEGPDIARIAALIGDPARANILTALMAGKALTATELSAEAGVTPQTASSHLARLTDGALVKPSKSGRHKYYTLASPEVAHVLESLMGLAAGSGHLRTRTGPRDTELRHARVCYNHLAGDMGLRLMDSLTARGHLNVSGETVTLSASGHAFAVGFGIAADLLTTSHPPLCRACLDWSERRHHLAGPLGRALLAAMINHGWASRVTGTRIIRFTPTGQKAFENAFPLL